MIVRFENTGVLIGVTLTLFSLESIATQGLDTLPGRQILFWVALFHGALCVAWFAKQLPRKTVMRGVTVVIRRKMRQWL